MKCDCGHYLGSNVPTTLTCRCGAVHFVQPEEETKPKSLGQLVRDEVSRQFGSRSCRCKDASALIDRWGLRRSIENVTMLATLLKIDDESTVVSILRQCHYAFIHASETQADRQRFCVECPHFSGAGCSQLAEPPKVRDRWRQVDPHWCPIGRPEAKPESNGGRITEIVAVTALSLLPHHREIQSAVLDSWRAFGLDVIAVNTPEEVEKLTPIYPQVGQWIESTDTSHAYSWPTQKINRLCKVADDIDRPILLINSDCQLHGDADTLLSRLDPFSLVVGIRHNFDGVNYALAKRERWGLDAFVIQPGMAETLPMLDLAIGRPVWDYWLPIHFRERGYHMEFIGEPLLFHTRHPVHWSREDWQMGADWIKREYQRDYRLDKEFRETLPYPPTVA